MRTEESLNETFLSTGMYLIPSTLLEILVREFFYFDFHIHSALQLTI